MVTETLASIGNKMDGQKEGLIDRYGWVGWWQTYISLKRKNKKVFIYGVYKYVGNQRVSKDILLRTNKSSATLTRDTEKSLVILYKQFENVIFKWCIIYNSTKNTRYQRINLTKVYASVL